MTIPTDRIDIDTLDFPVIAQRRARALAESIAQSRKEVFGLPPRLAVHGDICPALSYPKDHSRTWYSCSICGGFVRL